MNNQKWGVDEISSRGIPSYRQVYEALRSQIRGEIYLPDSLLPPEPQLEKQFGVSRTTVRKAIEMLRSDGLVSVRQGKGTTVADPCRNVQQLNRITSFSETLRSLGITARNSKLSASFVKPDRELANDLQVPEGEPVFHIQRLVVADGQPIAIMENNLIARYFPNIDKTDAWVNSLYRFLETHYGVSILSAMDRISARMPTQQETNILVLDSDTPLLINHRVTKDRRGPFESMDLLINADRFQFAVFCYGRPASASEN